MCFRVVRWGDEEGVRRHKLPVRAWIAISGIPFNHWDRCDLRKILIEFAQILDISYPTQDKTDLSVARLYVGCDDIGSIPEEITVIIGASIKIEIQIMEPPEIKPSKEN